MWVFLGIGAQRAGTSWLYHWLQNHPDIDFPSGKEIHFWDWIQLGYRNDPPEQYLKIFSNPKKKEGEITPAYATLEDRYVSEIARLNPELRIFFVLRNPIERAWSAALMGLRLLQMRFEEASEQWFIDLFRSQASLARGDYETTLRRWHRFFPKEQLLLLFYEELRQDPKSVLIRIAHHLKVDPAPFHEVSEEALRRPVQHPSLKGVERRSPPPSLISILRHLYRDRIISLEEYLQQDLSHWLYWDGGSYSRNAP